MSLFGNLKERALSKILVVLVRKLAEGDFGKGPAKVYWALAGIKTYTALILGIGAFGLTLASNLHLCAACGDYASIIAKIAGGLLAIGLFDGAVRIEPPFKPEEQDINPRRFF